MSRYKKNIEKLSQYPFFIKIRMETLRLRVIIIGVGCFQLPSISIDMYLIEAVSTKTKSGKDQSQSLEAVTALHYFLESDGGNITALSFKAIKLSIIDNNHCRIV